MRQYIYLLFLILIIGCKSTNRIVKLESSAVESTLKNKVTELGRRVLNSCNTSKFKPFTPEEATAEVISNITIDKISKTCKKFLFKYGKFENIQLVEILENKSTKSKIFRYKAIYERKLIKKELRITVNEDNLISEIKSTDWVDTFAINK